MGKQVIHLLSLGGVEPTLRLGWTLEFVIDCLTKLIAIWCSNIYTINIHHGRVDSKKLEKLDMESWHE